jgi:cyclophilin family peptidyl-prolyl cis-trans isomerase
MKSIRMTSVAMAIVCLALVTLFSDPSLAQKGKKAKKSKGKSAEVKQAKSNWTPPITGAKLAEYTAHPNRHLVIETAQGKITLQLFEKVAPNHVAHFLKLAKEKFYEGTTFHRVIPGFMIQGGDPNSKDDDPSNDGTGQPGQESVNAEFSPIHHARGILSTARRGGDVNSATSQFFIMVADNAGLDNQYTVWGQVVDGMDVVDKIVSLPDASGHPGANGNNPGKMAKINKMVVVGK